MTNTYTQIVTNIKPYEDETSLRLTLRSETLNYKEVFRDIFNRRINNNISELPYINNLNNIDSIDREGIIVINNTTTFERRLEFLNSIFTRENSDENRLFLINNTTNQVRIYLHDLLIRSANNSNILEEDLYRIGNIFLYTISNLDIEGLVLIDVIQNMRETMVIYNTNQVFSVLDTQVSSYNNYLENTGLATENQLQERVDDFNQEVDQRIFLNRKRLIYTGVGILGSMALTSIGVPQVMSGLVARSMIPTVTTIQSTPVEEIIRFRDILDESIKWFYNTIKSFNK